MRPRLENRFTSAASMMAIAWLATMACGPDRTSTSTPNRSETLDLGSTAFELVEATIPEIQAAFAKGELTSEQLVAKYLQRIEAYEPLLNAFIHINENALSEARERDAERARKGDHGPLFGIPILLKDNIDTFDMPTTAGALAFRDAPLPPDDAFIARKLRGAGMIILGKATLSELANYLTRSMPSGYSSLGGYGLNPYDPRPKPEGDGRPVLATGGSSSGSGIGVAANLVTVAIGTETSGSILSPSSRNGLVGIKPTVGLASRDGIVPLSASQDTPGPMARTVRDAAIVLGAITGVDPADPATSLSEGKVYADYTPFLDPAGLQGARIGVARAGILDTLPEDEQVLMQDAIEILRAQGAIVIDPADIESLPEIEAYPGCRPETMPECTSVFAYEFKQGLDEYLASRGAEMPIKTIQELADFNNANAETALKYGQIYVEFAAGLDLATDREKYETDRAKDLAFGGSRGIDQTMEKHDLDAILLPRNRWAGIAARAGYPSITVPAGFLPPNGDIEKPAPFGVTFTARAWSEPTLIKLAYAFEQATQFRKPPFSAPPLNEKMKQADD